MDKINAHDKTISETIGLRLQSKLTKEQAEKILATQQILLDGMLAKDTIKALKKMMLTLYI